jgi:hypothetical protein
MSSRRHYLAFMINLATHFEEIEGPGRLSLVASPVGFQLTVCPTTVLYISHTSRPITYNLLVQTCPEIVRVHADNHAVWSQDGT